MGTMSKAPESSWFPRFAAAAVESALADTRIVVVEGARQVGKSTLVERILSNRAGARFLTLDDPDVLAAARSDPVTFVRHEGLLAIDEIQRAPELLLPIKARVDRDRRPGRFLLTGSAHVLALPRLADTLTGRVELVELWPLSQGEIRRRAEGFVDRLFAGTTSWPVAERLDKRQVLERAFAGGFPEARVRSPSRRASWFEAYLQTFSTRDVLEIQDIDHPRRLRALLALVAARTTGLLNVADLGRDARLTETTTHRYLDLLTAALLLLRLPAWSTNRRQREVSSPKCYLADSGLCAHLLGADLDAIAGPTPDAGPILETLAVAELRKQLGWCGARASMHHLRTKDQVEVDVVLTTRNGRVAGVEVKAGATVGSSDFRGLRWLQARTGASFSQGVVLYTGEEVLGFGPGLWALPFSALWS
jgi:predicted AAA+ superfamily ATPase